MPLRYSISKNTATGESIIIDIAQCHPGTGDVMHTVEELDDMLKKALDSTTDRMFDMNMAMLEAYHLDTYFEPGVWLKVKQVMEVLAGRMQAQVLQHRWESAKEETAELELMRAKQAQAVGLQDSVPLNVAPISTVLPVAEPVVAEPDNVEAELHYPSLTESYPPRYREVEDDDSFIS